MGALLVSPFIIQAVVIALDEIAFHRVRGLPRWERIGHPIDTLSVILCLLIPLLLPLTRTTAVLYGGAAVASMLVVTKDEAVHARHCSGGELWLHAVLFLMHPLVLLAAFCLWAPDALPLPGPSAHFTHRFLVSQILLLVGFALYQTVYWNWARKAHPLKLK